MNLPRSNLCHSVPVWVAVVLAAAAVTALPGTAAAKSLYLASEHHVGQFDAWNIAADGTVGLQATYGLTYATDPAGIAIDAVHAPGEPAAIFITSEFSGGVEIVDPESLTYMGVSSGPQNLAGIDVDDVDNIIFTLQRETNQLYIYDWDPIAQTLAQAALITLPDLSYGYGLALDDAQDILWVSDTSNFMVRAYDVGVSNWGDVVEIPSLSFTVSSPPVDVALDARRNIVYTVGGWWGYSLLTKYDINTGVETTVDTGDRPIGVAVDERTGHAYVTYYIADSLNVWDPSVSPFALVQSTGDIGTPAGLAIGSGFIPFEVAKDDIIEGEVCIGETFTYEITYVNSNNSAVTNVTMLDDLPGEFDFTSATHGGIYNATEHTVFWDIGTVGATEAGLIELVVRVNQSAVLGSLVDNVVTVEGNEFFPFTVEDDQACAPDDLYCEPGTPICELVPVPIDILPGVCPNMYSRRDASYLPLALLGTENLDVRTIGLQTIEIARADGVGGTMAPNPTRRPDYDDVGTPFPGQLCECHDLGPDDFEDLSVVFRTNTLLAALELDTLPAGTEVELVITGLLNNGVPFMGRDCVLLGPVRVPISGVRPSAQFTESQEVLEAAVGP